MAFKKNEKRKENYKRLKEVGFNSYEATRFKDLKQSRVESIILKRKAFNDSLKDMEAK